jgi:hypothetical protein
MTVDKVNTYKIATHNTEVSEDGVTHHSNKKTRGVEQNSLAVTLCLAVTGYLFRTPLMLRRSIPPLTNVSSLHSSVALRPNWGPGRLTLEVFRSNTDTHSR